MLLYGKQCDKSITKIMQTTFATLTMLLLLSSISSCSITKMATKAVSETMGVSGVLVFQREEDPQLVKDSLPIILKANELFMELDPENWKVRVGAAKLFIIYSNLFLQSEADMMDYKQWKEQAELYQRAKKMYLRGSNYAKEALEIKYGIELNFVDPKSAEFDFDKEDADTLYWLGGGLMSAFSIDMTDPIFAPMRTSAVAFLTKAYQLDPDYGNGALHEFFFRYFSAIPEGMGGGMEKATYHYKKALEASEGKKASPYLAYATSISVKNQTQEGVEEFKKLIQTAIDFDVDKYPDYRLENTVTQKKAKWLLENIDNYFLVD